MELSLLRVKQLEKPPKSNPRIEEITMASPSQIQELDPDPPSIQQQNSPQIENPISNLEEITHQNDHPSPKTLEMSRIQDPERSHPVLEESHVILDLEEQEEEFSGNVISTNTKIRSRSKVYKRKKRGGSMRQLTIDKKVDNLLKCVNFVPFMPAKRLDFDKYEHLLKELGLWDFVRLEFDDVVRADWISQLIVSFDSAKRCCFVNGVRIYMSRSSFVKALNLPKPSIKKEKVVGSVAEAAIDLDAEGERVSEDCVKFLEDLVWNWVVLHGDDWVMPNEIRGWMGLIRDGHPERVDWGGMFWVMVENELKQRGDQLRECYYTSHLQYFIKSHCKVLPDEDSKKFGADEGSKEEGKLLSEEDSREAEVEQVKSQPMDLFEEVGLKVVADEGANKEVKLSSEEDYKEVEVGEIKKDEDLMEEPHKVAKEGINEEVKLSTEEDNKELEVEEIKKDEHLLEEPHKVDQKVAEEGDLSSERMHGVELVEKVKEGPNEAEVEKVKEDTDGSLFDSIKEVDNVVLGPNIELALGQQDVVEREKINGFNMMDVEECKEKRHDDLYLGASDHGRKPFLRPCILGEGRGSDGNGEGKQEVEQLQMEEGQQLIQEGKHMEDVEHIQRGEQMEEMEELQGWEHMEAEETDDVDEVEVDELEVDDTEEQVEVEDEDEELEDGMEHDIPQNYGSPGGAGLPGDLLQAFETTQLASNLQGQQIHENSSMELFAPNAETHLMMGGPSMYGNGQKRPIDYEQNTSHPNESKRIRTEGGWDPKNSEFGFCMGQAEQFMEKAKIMYAEKEQAYHELNMHQQYLLREVQQRDDYIESLERNSNESLQKKDAEIYRLERELGLLTELVNGYREALKENRRAFLEYRQRCQLPEEPIYKDAGPGGLVLSVTEIEKQRQQQENEDRLTRLMIEQKFTEAFEGYCNQFEVLLYKVQLIDLERLTPIENEVKLLKELSTTKRRASEKEDLVPTEIVSPSA